MKENETVILTQVYNILHPKTQLIEATNYAYLSVFIITWTNVNSRVGGPLYMVRNQIDLS